MDFNAAGESLKTFWSGVTGWFINPAKATNQVLGPVNEKLYGDYNPVGTGVKTAVTETISTFSIPLVLILGVGIVFIVLSEKIKRMF